jgi:hypothetical protein
MKGDPRGTRPKTEEACVRKAGDNYEAFLEVWILLWEEKLKLCGAEQTPGSPLDVPHYINH